MEKHNSNCDYIWDEETQGLKLVKCYDNPEYLIVPDEIDGIPVTMIGEYAFSNVKSAEIQGVSATILDQGVDGCNLRRIKLPENLKIINYCAFYGCNELEYVEVPMGVVEIRAGAFCFCENLEEILLPDSISVINRISFRNCRSLREVDVPDSVEEIDFSAFEGCQSLEYVYIGDNVKKIGNRAFWGCSSLDDVELPDSVESIGIGTFGKSGIRELYIPSGVGEIQPDTFRECRRLKRISLRKGTNIKDNALDENQNIEIITRDEDDVQEQVQEEGSSNISQWLYYWSGSSEEIASSSKVKLICFHYAGGNAGWFDSWTESTKNNLDMYTVQLPGRFARIDEEIPDSMEELATWFIHDCKELLTGKFILFGHSMGAQLAYEVSSQLNERGMTTPILLALSGCEAPVVAEIESTGISSLEASDEHIIEVLKDYEQMNDAILENEDFVEYYLPIVKGDFHLCENYVKGVKPWVKEPIVIFRGSDDSEVSVEGCQAWGDYTSSNIDINTMEGNHFFPENNYENIMSTIEGKAMEVMRNMEVV